MEAGSCVCVVGHFTCADNIANSLKMKDYCVLDPS